jgi:predicted nucleic-acid-binding Zn-ribbon protein
MDTTTMICPKCNGEMQEGFIAEYRRDGIQVSEWVAGPPQEPSFWGSIVSNKDRLPITVFRCTRCGYLESYAWRS